MKKILFLSLLILVFACENNDEECEDLYQEYLVALSHAGNSQSAINEVTRQYNEKKADLGCD